MAKLIGYLIGVAAGLAALGGYLYGSYLLLVQVLLPFLLGTVLLGVFLGLVLGVASVITSYWTAPRDLSPQEYREGRTMVGAKDPGPDLAWPLYGLAQARRDIERCWTTAATAGERPWKLSSRSFFGGDWQLWWFFWPIPVLVLLMLSVMSLTSVVVSIVLTAVALLVSTVVTVGQVLVAGVLRSVEWGWQRAVRAEASCPYCYYVSRRPAYRCRSCSELHRDVRPGRLGVLSRRCDCGALHPTTVWRAEGHFPAVCQRCGSGLEGGAATVRDVRVSIFGDVSAGKTRFLYAALDALALLAKRSGLPFSHPTEEARREAERALHVIRSGGDTAKTSPGSLPTALTCSIGKGPSRALVHLFDAAGEQYGDGGLHDSLGFLHSSRCLVFVIDPFSVAAVRDRALGANPAAVQAASPAAGDVEFLYTGVVRRIRDSGVKSRDQRLALVVSKADLLAASGIDVPSESDAIADWLTGLGLHNVVLSARQDFAEVRFFAVHSTAGACAEPSRAADEAIRWVLTASGIRLPASVKEVSPA